MRRWAVSEVQRSWIFKEAKRVVEASRRTSIDGRVLYLPDAPGLLLQLLIKQAHLPLFRG